MKVSVPERSQVSSFMVKVGLVLFVAGLGLFAATHRGPGKRRLFHVPRRPRTRRRARRRRVFGLCRSRSLCGIGSRGIRVHRLPHAIWMASNCRTERNSKSLTAPCATTTWPRNSQRVRTESGRAIRHRRPRRARVATASTTFSRANTASAPTAPAQVTQLCAKCHGSILKTVSKSPHGDDDG